jgi:hypothetical protein
LYAASRLGRSSSKGTSTVSLTRVGFRVSTALFTTIRSPWSTYEAARNDQTPSAGEGYAGSRRRCPAALPQKSTRPPGVAPTPVDWPARPPRIDVSVGCAAIWEPGSQRVEGTWDNRWEAPCQPTLSRYHQGRDAGLIRYEQPADRGRTAKVSAVPSEAAGLSFFPARRDLIV